MGLDMYLNKRIFIGGQYEHQEVKGTVYLTKKANYNSDEVKEVKIPINQLDEINLQAGYWRKANAIHKWFVDNVQGGKDECQTADVSMEQMTELRDVCKKIIEKWVGLNSNPEMKALIERELPPTSGFFFGNTSLDTEDGFQWYIQDLKDTINILDPIIEEGEEPDAHFTYQSSW